MASGGVFAGMPRTAGSSMLIMGRNEMSRAVTPPDTHDDPVFARMCAMLAPFKARGITITRQPHITTALEIDSVAVLDQIMEIEDEYGVSLPLNPRPENRTVRHLYEALHKPRVAQ